MITNGYGELLIKRLKVSIRKDNGEIVSIM
jgi:hypothetical protein